MGEVGKANLFLVRFNLLTCNIVRGAVLQLITFVNHVSNAEKLSIVSMEILKNLTIENIRVPDLSGTFCRNKYA